MHTVPFPRRNEPKSHMPFRSIFFSMLLSALDLCASLFGPSRSRTVMPVLWALPLLLPSLCVGGGVRPVRSGSTCGGCKPPG